MNDRWKYIKGRDGEYPEAFIIYVNDNRLKVEANLEKKRVKIYLESADGEIVESQICNGVVLKERDILGNSIIEPADVFKTVSSQLSSIPDSKVVRLIGRNYGVIAPNQSDFQAEVSRDILFLKSVLEKIKKLPERIIRNLLKYFQTMLEKPSLSDIFDMVLAVSAGYGAYLYNFNYALAGIIVAWIALSSGYVDWIIRNKSPYILKIIVLIVPACYIILQGVRYQ